jgi:hypothetical protein
MRNAYKILVGKSEGKRPLRRPRLRWEDIIRINFTQIDWEFVDWIHLDRNKGQGVGPCEHGNELIIS